MIMEGLATTFEVEAAKDNNFGLEFFVKTIQDTSDRECEKVLKILGVEPV